MYSIIHASMEPLIYSIVISYGLISMAKKVKDKRYMALVIEVAIFALIFIMHGGSVTGGFASTIASIIAGNVIAKMLEPQFERIADRVSSFLATCTGKLNFAH